MKPTPLLEVIKSATVCTYDRFFTERGRQFDWYNKAAYSILMRVHAKTFLVWLLRLLFGPVYVVSLVPGVALVAICGFMEEVESIILRSIDIDAEVRKINAQYRELNPEKFDEFGNELEEVNNGT
jgi:hypothetical protein